MATKLITTAVFNGTSLNLAISGKNVDSVMKALRRKREVRNATCFLFYSRKTGKLIDTRMN